MTGIKERDEDDQEGGIEGLKEVFLLGTRNSK